VPGKGLHLAPTQALLWCHNLEALWLHGDAQGLCKRTCEGHSQECWWAQAVRGKVMRGTSASHTRCTQGKAKRQWGHLPGQAAWAGMGRLPMKLRAAPGPSGLALR